MSFLLYTRSMTSLLTRTYSTVGACPVPPPASKEQKAPSAPHPLVGQDIKSDTVLRAVDGEKLTASSLLANKTVVLFGVPGAFTPTCSSKHVPAFIEQAAALKAKGVDLIGCVSVNDRFVMDAWGNQLNVGDAVEMLSDFDGSFVAKLGLDIDLAAPGLGRRAKRFSLLVKDGRVIHAEVEESPGDFKVTGPEPILHKLTPSE